MMPEELSINSIFNVVIIFVLGYLLGVIFLYEKDSNKESRPFFKWRPPRG
jgi:predicted permease